MAGNKDLVGVIKAVNGPGSGEGVGLPSFQSLVNGRTVARREV